LQHKPVDNCNEPTKKPYFTMLFSHQLINKIVIIFFSLKGKYLRPFSKKQVKLSLPTLHQSAKTPVKTKHDTDFIP
jgi:hypothetical protein